MQSNCRSTHTVLESAPELGGGGEDIICLNSEAGCFNDLLSSAITTVYPLFNFNQCRELEGSIIKKELISIKCYFDHAYFTWMI